MSENKVIYADFGERPLSLRIGCKVDVLYADEEVMLVRLETSINGETTVQFITERI